MLCTAWPSSSLFANGRTAGAAVTADVLSGAADAGEELEPPRSSAGRTFLLPRSDVIVCTLPRAISFAASSKATFCFLGPTAQIGRFIARSATQLCNHAGLGLGRHAMNLKELHLGPRPRAAALTRRATSWFRRVGKRPRGSRENHETKNTTHTNTTAYQCPKKTPKWYLPPKYREIDNTAVGQWTLRGATADTHHRSE